MNRQIDESKAHSEPRSHSTSQNLTSNLISKERNPQIVALAREASRQINRLGEEHRSRIEAIYRDFRAKADAVRRGEASAAVLDGPGADASQTTEQQS